MSTVPRPHRKYQSAAEWPAWTDEVRYTVTEDFPPSPEDREWAAAHLNGDEFHTDEPTPVEVLDDRDAEALAIDQAAEEAEALDRLERGHAAI